MGWGTEGEPLRRQSSKDPVLAALASAEERKVKRWDPVVEQDSAPKVVDAEKAKKRQEAFLKKQAAGGGWGGGRPAMTFAGSTGGSGINGTGLNIVSNKGLRDRGQRGY